MINVYVESPNDKVYNRIRYVMTQILIPIGFPFRIVMGIKEDSASFSILCVPAEKLDAYRNDDRFNLVIPYNDFALWTTRDLELKMDKIEGIPVLYIGQMPQFLIHERQVGFDLINLVFFLLTRQEEYIYQHRDQWDRFSSTYSILYDLGVLQVPIINHYINYIESYIRRFIREVPQPRWKGNAPYAVVLSHDVDHLPSKDITIILNRMVQFSQCSNVSQKVKRIIRYLIDILTFKRESEPRWKLSYWTEKEREYGFRSTFFLSANISQRHENDTTYWLSSKVDYNGKKARLSQIAKELEEDGWEIGLHGSMNSYRDSNLLLKELDLLINNTHCKVTGIRQHYLRFDIRNTWHIHEALHLQYDTTLGYDNRIGFRGGIALPFVPYDLDNEREYKLLEIPMCIMDSSLFFVTGEKLDIEKSLKRCQNIVDNIKQTSGLLVINFHPHFYAAPYPDWWKVYDSILERLSNDCAWVANASKIAGWWTEKCKLVSEE